MQKEIDGLRKVYSPNGSRFVYHIQKRILGQLLRVTTGTDDRAQAEQMLAHEIEKVLVAEIRRLWEKHGQPGAYMRTRDARTVVLPMDIATYMHGRISAGDYANEIAVIRAGVRALRQRDQAKTAQASAQAATHEAPPPRLSYNEVRRRIKAKA